LILAFGSLHLYRLAQPDGLRRLVTAVGTRRFVEPRLSGGFDYAPFPSPRRGPVPLDRLDPDEWGIVEAAEGIRQDAERADAGVDDRRALGLAHLLLGNLNEAVETLEALSRSRPGDAQALSDLAAAYLVRSDGTGGAEDRVRAIDAARHAVEIDSTLAEARFNLALALEKQVASDAIGAEADAAAAIEAWEEYLLHDVDSSWADEARRRVAALRNRSAGLPTLPTLDMVERAARTGDVDATMALIRPNPRVGREVLERRLLPEWSAAYQEQRAPTASASLAAAASLARAIEGVSGDPLENDTVRAVEDAVAEGRGGQALAAALNGYARSIDLYERDEMQAASPGFRAAEAAFEGAGVPLRWSASLYASITDYYDGRLAIARENVDKLGARDTALRYPSLLARVRWVQGLLRAVTGDLSGALEHYREALGLFERVGETDGVASANFLIAEGLDLLGDREVAWRHRATALAFASRVAAGQRRPIHLDATFAALAQGRPWAALTFQAPVFEPWSAAEPGALAEAYQIRAMIFDAIGDPDAALEDLESSKGSCAAIGDPGLRRRLEAELSATRGTTLVGREPRDAVVSLGQAIAYFEEVGATSRLPALYLDRGRAQQAIGAFRDAESDYARGVDLLERTHAGLIAEPQRVSFLDRAWTLFDAIVALEAGPLENPGQAFLYAERARRTELLAPRERPAAHAERGLTARPQPDEPLDAKAVAREMTGDQALVLLVMVPDRLLRWVFHDGRWDFRPQPLAIPRVESLVERVRGATEERNEKALLNSMIALYDLLLRPIEDLLPPTGVLYIVPDRRLDDVPYSALLDGREGRYVLERYATVIAPTAGLVATAPRARERARDGPRVLVVGSPAFDARRHPDLAPLPAAEVEASRIAALYPGSVLLTGRDATAARFLQLMATADIIHFAGHAIANDRHPFLSALVMAPEPEGGARDLLTALDLQQAATMSARLVVLGACRASGGGTERPGGAFSLARPFLAAGVPAVVGTQWAVGDRPAAAILSAFHLEFRRGASAASSLRAAQLAALHGPDPETRSPLTWGAFLVNGTATPREDHLKEGS
jgi:CHAT domain-containing protein